MSAVWWVPVALVVILVAVAVVRSFRAALDVYEHAPWTCEDEADTFTDDPADWWYQ